MQFFVIKTKSAIKTRPNKITLKISFVVTVISV